MNILVTWLLIATPFASRADVRQGSQVVPANVTTGAVVAVGGNLDVFGTVRGDATAIRGDVIVHRGARVDGRATAILGQVRNEGGSIGGGVREYGRGQMRTALVQRSYAVRHSPWRLFRLAVSWLLVVMVIGFAVISYAGDKVEIVVNTIRDGVGKSIGAGLLGHLAILPGAVGVMVLLGVTIIGILIIPLGLVAYMFLVSGIAMFGFIAVALLTGAAISGRKSRDDTPRGAMLRAFVTGACAYLGLWVIAAAFAWMPLVGALLRSLAAGATFIAVTAGFGAVLRSYWRGDFAKRAATG
jgi:hypothetical protein